MAFAGRTRVISGGGRGIGLQIAAALGALAAKVVLLGTTVKQCLIDADVLTDAGVTDLSRYGGQPPLQLDIFVDALTE